jgi:apolipoprotein N-acyltransferase
VVAGLMEATSLTFVIVATEIGVAARLISTATSASLLAAGLLSAAIFPAVALRLLAEPEPTEPQPEAEPAQDIPGNAQSPGHRHDRGFLPRFHRGG